MSVTTDSPVISVDDFKALHRPLVLDCRFNLADPEQGYADYRKGHIPGAYYLHLEHDLSGPVAEHGGRHPLPDPDTLARRLRSMGLMPGQAVVVYDDQRMAYAARARWLLRYLGHRFVWILDGGYQAWLASGGATDRREPAPRMGRFQPEPAGDWTRDYHFISNALSRQDGQITLIDSRDARRYQGLEEPLDPVAGHIPGALNVPWQAVVDERGYFKPGSWHQDHWADIKDKEEVVVYCGSGVTACVNLLSLEAAGIPARLYPGSWSDWCSYLVKTR